MPWLYEDLLPAVRRLFALREELTPYLYEEAERCRRDGEPLLRPVFLEDEAYDSDSDCFLCGSRILVCPVFDAGAAGVTVTLPRLGGGWRLRGAGESLPDGRTVTVPCAPMDDPVWFVLDHAE